MVCTVSTALSCHDTIAAWLLVFVVAHLISGCDACEMLAVKPRQGKLICYVMLLLKMPDPENILKTFFWENARVVLLFWLK